MRQERDDLHSWCARLTAENARLRGPADYGCVFDCNSRPCTQPTSGFIDFCRTPAIYHRVAAQDGSAQERWHLYHHLRDINHVFHILTILNGRLYCSLQVWCRDHRVIRNLNPTRDQDNFNIRIRTTTACACMYLFDFHQTHRSWRTTS